MEWQDRSVLEAASWRLVSELVRRHPERMRLSRTYPGGGQDDCLTIDSQSGPGVIQLNRHGTIQLHECFDVDRRVQWEPVEWDEYLRADPREFLHRLEHAAGLRAPTHVPSSTPTTLSYRLLSALAATAVKAVHPIAIQQGFIDSSGYGGGPNPALDAFAISGDLLRPRPDDPYDESGYRFWITLRDDVPILAFEQSGGFAWSPHRPDSIGLMKLYARNRRSVVGTAAALLAWTDQV
jgi:hypothetical protein